jgi:hypothetical protein
MRKPARIFALVIALVVPLLHARLAHAQMERLGDDQIKRLLDQVRSGTDRFVDAMDDRTRRSVLRGPQGDVDVNRFLKDFKDQIDKARDRFKPEYSAGAEVFALLRQASDIDRAMQAQMDRPPKSASEWEALAANLRALAENYNLPWPVDASATGGSRVNDRALIQSARELERRAKSLGNAIKKDKAIDKAAREATARDTESFARAAKTLAERLDDKRPATAEARDLLNRASTLAEFCRREPLGGESRRAWSLVQRNVDTIARAFGVPRT